MLKWYLIRLYFNFHKKLQTDNYLLFVLFVGTVELYYHEISITKKWIKKERKWKSKEKAHWNGIPRVM